MSTPSQRFRAVSKDPVAAPGPDDGEGAQILPFPFIVGSTDDPHRRDRMAVRPLTKPGLERLARAQEPSTPDDRKTDRDRELDRELEAWRTEDEAGHRKPPRSWAFLRRRGPRVAGALLATCVGLWIAGQLASLVFFQLSTSWIAPVLVSPQDEVVTSARRALVEQQDLRDRAAADVAHADRTIAAHREFQATVRPAEAMTRSQLELAKALSDREVLATSLERRDALIATLARSPYLRAATGAVAFARVPYENLDGVAPGAPVFACRLSFLACRKVGSVKEVVDGEIAFDPPHGAATRGRLVELQIRDVNALQREVLFVGDEPLGF